MADGEDREEPRRFGAVAGMALTVGSAAVWGLAHLATGRRRMGWTLLTMQASLVLIGLLAFIVGPNWLLGLVVRAGWLTGLTTVLLGLGVGWAALVIRSHLMVRPIRPGPVARIAGNTLAAALCVAVAAPMAYAARVASLSREVVESVFAQDPPGWPKRPEDPWRNRSRVNILLIGADAAPGRPGVRTDSMTVASIDPRTGRTVLFGLPRNLAHPPMPRGPARERFPFGFTGDGPGSPGILNGVYQYAEDHPETVPEADAGERGPSLLKRTVGRILGLRVDHYVMVDMKGFAAIVDAIGGVTVTVRAPVVYGKYDEGHISPGTQRLSGAAALWFGRSRTGGDDYIRMSRQKCLLNALARQADPITVLHRFDRLAHATKRAVSTDIPQSLLPDLIELADKVQRARIESVQFVPPLIDPAAPDYPMIRRLVRDALVKGSGERRRNRHEPGPQPSFGPSAGPRPVSLDDACH
ncbi:LCP family protein [Thermostaphylospora chromogena]|uniref:Cell envelope-related function transcriptional attenuator common domain-containing protein n=1 Tax=Thermostaphylospora chromogena TaxID=35622 RepID=A0A1H1CCQ8_9ACTN|nr:LCP family protein [Thermostaphylospora chromogena]SDQ61869.1 cell envelope-related function transcriptional attenuator common domain-containing protein [Thermostaphylospora chromogena]